MVLPDFGPGEAGRAAEKDVGVVYAFFFILANR
jgi:hypothetical protein